MFLEDTPRLRAERWPMWVGMLCLAAFWVVMDIVEPRDATMVVAVGVLYGTLILSALIAAIMNRMKLRRVVRALRSLGDASRSTVLAELPDQSAAILERVVSWHGRPEIDGLIERFRFSPIDQGETRILAHASWGAAAITAILIVSPLLPTWGRISLSAVAAVFTLTGARLNARGRDSNRWFEVSPFGLSEVDGDGSVRRVLWGMPLVLRNNQAAKRFDLSVQDAPGVIEIPYAVVQLERMLELIVEKGGLTPEAGLSPEP